MWAYIIALLVLIVAASVYLAYLRNQNWRRFAAKYRFRFSQGAWLRKPVVRGKIQGRGFQLAKSESSSDTGVLGVELIEMRMAVLGQLPGGLQVTKGMAALTGEPVAETVRTGDENFDSTALVSGDRASDVIAYLTPDRRRALLDLLSFEGADWCGVRDGHVVLTERRMVSSLPNLDQRFQFLFDIARRLDAS